MKRTHRLSILLILVSWFILGTQARAACREWQVTPLGRNYAWVDDVPTDWNEPAPVDGRLADYRELVRSIHPEYDPISDLRTQAEVFRRYMGDEAAQLHEYIVSGQVGSFTEVTCLEFRALDAHLKVRTLRDGTEVRVALFRRGERRRLILSHGIQPGVSLSFRPIQATIDRWVADGWIREVDFHNHPFLLDPAPVDRGGTLIPSGWMGFGDLTTFGELVRNAGLSEARISNGFHSIRFSSAEIEWMLERRPRRER
jgi:hypothetical protein